MRVRSSVVERVVDIDEASSSILDEPTLDFLRAQKIEKKTRPSLVGFWFIENLQSFEKQLARRLPWPAPLF